MIRLYTTKPQPNIAGFVLSSANNWPFQFNWIWLELFSNTPTSVFVSLQMNFRRGVLRLATAWCPENFLKRMSKEGESSQEFKMYNILIFNKNSTSLFWKIQRTEMWYICEFCHSFILGPKLSFKMCPIPLGFHCLYLSAGSVRKLYKLTQLMFALKEDLAKPLLDRFPLGTRFARKVIIPPSFNRCSSIPLAPRALHFVWCSPILCWHRIILSNRLCYNFTIVVITAVKKVCFESSGWKIECFVSQIVCFES